MCSGSPGGRRPARPIRHDPSMRKCVCRVRFELVRSRMCLPLRDHFSDRLAAQIRRRVLRHSKVEHSQFSIGERLM